MPGANDNFFIPYSNSYQYYHKEQQRQHGQDILEESDEDVHMQSENNFSQEEIVAILELQKEVIKPQNSRYFMRKRTAKQQNKMDKRTQKHKKMNS